jgi:DNA-binding response OmpR family regulator
VDCLAVRLGIDGSFQHRPLSVFVADVDEVFTERIRSLLEGLGHSVAVAHDGLHAMNTSLTGQFQLYIVSLDLPTVSGSLLVKALREGKGDEAVIFAITPDSAEEAGVYNAYQCGADVCLSKPLDEDELARFVGVVGTSC